MGGGGWCVLCVSPQINQCIHWIVRASMKVLDVAVADQVAAVRNSMFALRRWHAVATAKPFLPQHRDALPDLTERFRESLVPLEGHHPG